MQARASLVPHSLDEPYPARLRVPPHDPGAMFPSLLGDVEVELVRDGHVRRNEHLSSNGRQVADRAIDGRMAIVEHDPGSEERAGPAVRPEI